MRIENRVYKAVLSFLLSCLPLAVSAQSSSINTFSPYSYYGIGDIMAQGPSFSRAMGGVGLGFRSPIAINSLNPASYSAINRQTALFQVGLYGQNYYLRSQDTKSSYNTFNVSEIALQLPIAEGLGFTVGISPFSSVGYRITQSEEGSVDLGGDRLRPLPLFGFRRYQQLPGGLAMPLPTGSPSERK